jgi:hypothetical protein
VIEKEGFVLIVLLNELDGALRKDVAVVRRVAAVARLCLVPAVDAVALDAPARRLRKVVLRRGLGRDVCSECCGRNTGLQSKSTSPPTRKPSEVSKPRATGVYSCL